MTWTPVHPPVKISSDEWILIRDDESVAAAVVRRFETPRGVYFRVVSWAERSEDRELVGRFPTLAEADRAVLYRPREISVRAGKEFAIYPDTTRIALSAVDAERPTSSVSPR